MSQPNLRLRALAIALAIAMPSSLTHAQAHHAQSKQPQAEQAEPPKADEHIVVTHAQMQSASTVVIDPKQPRQPLPAQDAADFLKTIPGFNVIRKGGVSGDPTFRSMAASRLTIMSDNGLVLGGCNSRMDPPTAYITPHNYDVITVIKGPQSVLYLPSQATVLFERESYRLNAATFKGQLGTTVASHQRRDLELDLTAGNEQGYARLTANNAEGDDYRDGDNNPINSDYQRWSYNAEFAWTPTDDTSLIFSWGQSDAEAAYADRAMDGVKFDRTSKGIKLRHDNLTEVVKRIELSLNDTYVDHVMDNYSLRSFTPSMMMPNPSAMNPDRDTQTYRLSTDLAWRQDLALTLGLDQSDNKHANRMSMNQPQMPYQTKPRMSDGRFKQQGWFAEVSYQPQVNLRILAGLRSDRWQAWDDRAVLKKTMQLQIENPSYQAKRDEDLTSAFTRIEYQHQGHTWYAGLGQAERFPDYWELIGQARGSESSASAFFIASEQTQQLDIGWLYRGTALSAEIALFYGTIDNYILLEQQQMMGPETVRNIDATVWGGEASVSYKVTPQWRLQASIASSRGSNDTDNLALAQQAPLEMRISSDYQWQDWSFGTLWRLVDAQTRIAPKQGTIVGLDSTATAGFGTLAVNASKTFAQQWRFSVGIDNLLDKTYQEHLSRQAATIPGYTATERVNEPGRIAWLRLDYQF
jgi:iron complex outermembrane receptor protein